LVKNRDLLTLCRQECGSRIFLDGTLKTVIHCYETYEHKKSDADAQSRHCVENMGSRQCVEETHRHTTPQTVTINATEFLHSKRNNNRKLTFPGPLDSLISCTRTCVRNQGVVQFNADGTPVKSKVKENKNCGNCEKEKQDKNGNGFSHCAMQLNCQLSPVDKKLEKHARQLCKFHAGQQEDNELNLCTCLETALGQNLHCTEQLSTAETCSSPASQSSGKN
jgi:hypothetical protein